MKTLVLTFALLITLTSCVTTPDKPTPGYSTQSPEAYQLQRASLDALGDLYQKNADARFLRQSAQAILVFPEITKGGFVVGAQGGKGTLFTREGGVEGYYSTVAASYGLQAGIQQFGNALFINDEYALRQLKKAKGWEIGSNPGFTYIDMGATRSISTATATPGVYAFFFNQRGLMAGLGLQGSKYTRIYP